MGRIESWVLFLARIVLVGPVWAGGPDGSSALVTPSATPGVALARYVAAASERSSWTAATVEIDASLPRLARYGRLSAIRRLLPLGKAQYEVLAMDGDRTVRQQVIARYLSADLEAAALPPASVAITSANYRFRYVGSAADRGTLAYAFEITPRKKRAGLFRGQLWIDPCTGMALRLTGYLVKNPSVFVRRVNITRDTYVHAGVAYALITHIDIDTRLIGRAELTIAERPYSPTGGEEIGLGGPNPSMRQQEERR